MSDIQAMILCQQWKIQSMIKKKYPPIETDPEMTQNKTSGQGH